MEQLHFPGKKHCQANTRNEATTHRHEVWRNRETRLSSSLTPVWMMILSSLLFACMGVFVKLSSAYYTTGELVFYRSLIGLILMLGAACAQRGSLLTTYPKAHLLRSLCGAIGLSLWFYSIEKLPLAMAMTLNYTAPVWMIVFVMVGAQLKGRRQVPSLLLMTSAIGFAGMVLILQPTMQDKQWLAGLIGLLSGLVSAIAFLQVAALGKAGEPGYRIVFYLSLVGIMLGAAIVMIKGEFHSHTLAGLLLLLAMGILAAGAQWSLSYAFSHGKTLANASLQYLTIAFSSFTGSLFFGDHITLLSMSGIILVIASGIIAACFRDEKNRK